MDEDLFSWGFRAGIPEAVIMILIQQGILNVSDLHSLSGELVDAFFGISGILTQEQVEDLKKAMSGLCVDSPQEHKGFSNATDDEEEAYLEDNVLQTYQICPPCFPIPPQHESDIISTNVEESFQESVAGFPETEARRSSPRNDTRFDMNKEKNDIAQAMSLPMVREDAPREVCRPTGACYDPVSPEKDKAFSNTVTEHENTLRLLLLGKTGSGKSTTGNTILGQNLFNTAPDFGSVTRECERQVGFRNGTRIEIMDSPGLYDTTKSHAEICTIIIQAVAGMHPGPHAVLYVIKVGRFTDEEHNAYLRLKTLFDDSISQHIILLFTHGDNLERQGETLQGVMASPSTPANLRKVFMECGHRCLLINNMAENTGQQVDILLAEVRKLVSENGGRPYNCPKYSKIGQGLEEEVSKRMEAFDKKDLQRQKFVQDLERQTKLAEQEAERVRQQFLQKEAEREQTLRQEEQRAKHLEQQLQEKLNNQDKLSQKQRRELKQLEQECRQLEEQQERLLQKQKKQRQQDMENLDRRYREFEKKREQERREERKKNKKREKEMEKLKQRVVKKEEPSFLDSLSGVLGGVFKAITKLF